MSAAKGNDQPDRQEMMTVLVPALGVAGLIILIAVVALFSGSDKGRPMSDGSDGSATDPGLTELASGVKFRDLKVGTGAECMPGGDIRAKYTGWLTDGTVFDKGSAVFKLADVVAGWQKGIPGMRPGGVRKLVVPPELGYGAKGSGKVKPNSTLIFEVELLEVVSAPGGAAGGTPGVAPTKLSDGTAPGDADSGLKDIGEGLMVRDLKEGTGAEVRPGATVVAHYTGWLTNGESFDSSRKRGEPTEFSLRRVVPGWQRGIPGMKVGGVRKLVIPAPLAYGTDGRQGIPPNSTLVFEVEIVDVKQ